MIGTYIVTQGDVDAGKVENVGSACANTEGPPCDEDPHEEPVEDPSILVEKSPDDQTVDQGDPFTWTIKVTNTGNVPLTNVEVKDALVPACDNVIGALAVGQVVEYTCVVPDVQNIIFNVAAATGDYGDVEVEDEDPSTLFIIDAAAFIGDTVWLDLDGDGIEDDGTVPAEGEAEPGVPNVDVVLYVCNDLDGDPECDDDFDFVETTTTDSGRGLSVRPARDR